MTIAPAAAVPYTNSRASAEAVAVRCEGLSKRFLVQRGWAQMLRRPLHREYKWSVRNVSLEIRRGEFFGLLGPNGAGKTTLFRLLSSAVIPDEGTATVNGFDVERDSQRVRRSLASVAATDRSLNWRLSATENLKLFSALYGLKPDVARRRIDEVLELVGLAREDAKMVANFSSGMRQRLSIARALLDRPPILFLDEPTRSLDPVSARDLRVFLRRQICEIEGCTVVLATHETEEAFHLCDRVGVLHGGEMIATGRPAQLMEQFRDDVFRVLTREPDHPAFEALHAEYGVPVVGRPDLGDSPWRAVDLEIASGEEGAAQVVAALVRAGVSVARCEKVPLSLADLLERVVAARANRRDQA